MPTTPHTLSRRSMVGLRGAASPGPELGFGVHLCISYLLFCPLSTSVTPQSKLKPHLSAVRSLSFFPRLPLFLPFFPLPCRKEVEMSNIFIKNEQADDSWRRFLFFKLLLHLWQKSVVDIYVQGWLAGPLSWVHLHTAACQSVSLYSPMNST